METLTQVLGNTEETVSRFVAELSDRELSAFPIKLIDLEELAQNLLGCCNFLQKRANNAQRNDVGDLN